MADIEQGSLMTATIELLKVRKQSFPEIAKEVGVSFYWIRKFIHGGIPNPGVNTIQKLYEYLSGRTLKVHSEPLPGHELTTT